MLTINRALFGSLLLIFAVLHHVASFTSPSSSTRRHSMRIVGHSHHLQPTPQSRPSSSSLYANSKENDDKDSVSSSEAMEETNELLNFAGGLGEFDPNKKIPIKREVLVGNPQLKVKKKDQSVTAILQELASIQKQGPRKYCILGTRHCSYLHQQIIELLSYALVLSENHVYTSGAGGTNAAAIRGALRAERPDLLTVILPQSLSKQSKESQELLKDVTDLIAMPQNDEMSLDVASRLCNSKLLSETDQLIAFAFHASNTVIEATKEAKKLEMLVTMLFWIRKYLFWDKKEV